jgi:predicted O-methyltransferase YrrM
VNAATTARRLGRRLLPARAKALAYRLNIAQKLIALEPTTTADVIRESTHHIDPARIDLYKNSLNWPFRAVLTQAVVDLGATSALELGCHVGPSLMLLGRRVPGIQLEGVEVNAQLAEEARRWLAELPNVVIHNADLRTFLRERASASIDCVFAGYTLSLVGPEDLDRTLADCWRVARKGVVLAENQAIDGLPEAKLAFEWRHDYRKAWARVAPDAVVTLLPVTQVSRLNAVIVARRADA